MSSSPETTESNVTRGTTPEVGTARVKRGMAEMLKGGVIMDVVTPEQAYVVSQILEAIYESARTGKAVYL